MLDRSSETVYNQIEHFCDRHGTKLTVMNGEIFSPEEELVRDLIAMSPCFQHGCMACVPIKT